MRKLYMMCFYESNVRYFHFAESKFAAKGIELVYLCMYPSAVKYCKRHELKYKFLPLEVRNKGVIGLVDFKSNVEEDSKFHNFLLPSLKSDFEKLFRMYSSYYNVIFNDDNCLGAVLIGDVRLFSSSAKVAAEKYNKKLVYFEPGPFSTMIFDENGVNKNMTISKVTKQGIFEAEVNQASLEMLYKNNSQRKYYDGNFFAYFRKVHDVFLSVPPDLLRSKLYPELQTGESLIESIPYLISRVFTKRKNNPKKEQHNKKFIFFPLQVPCDVQIIINSPNFGSINEMLSALINSIPDGFNLVVREHPMNMGRYGDAFYKLLNDKNVILDNENDINELIEKAELVVVNNSTVGVEALKTDTSVMILGDSYYDACTHKYNPMFSLKEQIINAIENPISRDFKDKYLTLLYEDYLIKDNYKNLHYDNLELLVKRISRFYA
ncbi:hypothetical protein [Pseudoalteromonas marina]|uniref:Capsule polysaccharide biosynthesis protein n=1 Tax=Pseudoalteromonas marina TaxID=267375 RepID=A0ABT9FDJ1_9GAMM|nr:hypothetical protein [Pseudoalteromonas marina]MDP2564798.1 hypothetical protein [Pseudoalteromonas marina]